MMTWPKPVQNPLPVIVGGDFPHAARRVVRYGNGWAPIAGRKLLARSTADPNSLSAALGFDGRGGEGRGEVGDSGALRVKPTLPSHACGVGPSLSPLKGRRG